MFFLFYHKLFEACSPSSDLGSAWKIRNCWSSHSSICGWIFL